MQSVFSIKDAISKKESREISALLGVTVTQVYITPLPVYSLLFLSWDGVWNQYFACRYIFPVLYLCCC